MATDTKFVRGAQKLSQRLRTIQRTVDLPGLTDAVGELLLQRNLRRFDAQQDPDGKRWPALQADTMRRKARDGYGGKRILQRTGKLRASIRLIRGGTGTIFTNTGAGVRIGIDNQEVAVYGRMHNQGIYPQPKRRFLGVSALDIRAADGLARRRAKKLQDTWENS